MTTLALAPRPDRLGGEQSAVAPASAELTVVVPCRNEAENVPALVERLRRALAGVVWEVVFVDDDSPDGTAVVAKAIAVRDPGCAASGASAAAAFLPPASKACWRPPRPSWR